MRQMSFFQTERKNTPLVLTCSALSCLHIRNKTGTNRLRCTTNRAGKQKTVRRSVVLSQINCIHWVNKAEGNSRPGFHHVVFEEANRCRRISGWRRLLAVRSAARLNRQNRGILGCGLIFSSLPKLKDKLFDLETEGFADCVLLLNIFCSLNKISLELTFGTHGWIKLVEH